MLSAADAELASRDSELPGLAVLLDPAAFLQALRAVLPGVPIERAVPSYTRYKPHTNCLAAFELSVGNQTLLAYAKLYGRGAEAKLTKLRVKSAARGPLGAAPIVLAESRIAVFPFPYDAKLDLLERLDDADALERMMAKVAPDRPELWRGSLRLLRYKPERRYVGHLRCASGAEAALRVYAGDEFQASNKSTKKLKSRGSLRLARRLGAWKRRYAMAIEWVPGTPLRGALDGTDPDLDAYARTGAALAELHAQSHPVLPRHAPQTEVGRLGEVAEAIAFLCPSQESRARRLVERLAPELVARGHRICAVHGDFYDDQVLLSDDRIAVLDLDRAGLGDPAADLGNFAAHLERDAITAALPAATAAAATAALWEGYRQATEDPVDGLEIHTAAALLKLATEPFRRRRADWPERCEQIVARAEAILAGAASAAQPAGGPEPAVVVRGADAANDPRIPVLAAAVDPVRAAALLLPALSERLPAHAEPRLRRIEVIRHKPGRRCLIDYSVEMRGPDGSTRSASVIGKLRGRGLDKGTYEVVRRLWEAGWDDRCPDAICIPEPMGVVPELQMWLQRRFPGRTATELLPDPGGEALAARVAEVLHKLHQSAVPPRRAPHSLADELRILHEQLGRVLEERPAWNQRIARVFSACERLASRLGPRQAATIHRDFYSDQLIVDGRRLCLLDLDLYCEGDPALDAGNFLAHLTEQALRTCGDACRLADREDALRERFLELCGTELREAVAVYEILSLVRHINISNRIAERRSLTEPILDLCEERLDLGRPRAGASDHST